METAILGATRAYGNLSVAVLSGGVGGARLARALSRVLPAHQLTVVVNVGDDDDVYGVRVCADLDTVTYTLAGIEGPEGWGIAGDTFTTMEHLASLGVDTTFRLGDRDLATCLARTAALRRGTPLSTVTGDIIRSLGVTTPILPATDAPLRTRVRTAEGAWLSFQEWFVGRGHRDTVTEVEFAGADDAAAAPGVIEAIRTADAVVIAPSNPIVSVWPILAITSVRRALRRHTRVVAVSPLFGGKALKGPAAELLRGQGFPAGNAGVLAAYDGLLDDLVVDVSDSGDVDRLTGRPGRDGTVAVHATSTRLGDPAAAARFGRWLCDLIAAGPDAAAAPIR